MTVEILGQDDRRHVGKDTAVTTCQGCGMYRLCRRTSKGLWLCIGGPSKCYRHRKVVSALKARKENDDEGKDPT